MYSLNSNGFGTHVHKHTRTETHGPGLLTGVRTHACPTGLKPSFKALLDKCLFYVECRLCKRLARDRAARPLPADGMCSLFIIFAAICIISYLSFPLFLCICNFSLSLTASYFFSLTSLRILGAVTSSASSAERGWHALVFNRLDSTMNRWADDVLIVRHYQPLLDLTTDFTIMAWISTCTKMSVFFYCVCV